MQSAAIVIFCRFEGGIWKEQLFQGDFAYESEEIGKLAALSSCDFDGTAPAPVAQPEPGVPVPSCCPLAAAPWGAGHLAPQHTACPLLKERFHLSRQLWSVAWRKIFRNPSNSRLQQLTSAVLRNYITSLPFISRFLERTRAGWLAARGLVPLLIAAIPPVRCHKHHWQI